MKSHFLITSYTGGNHSELKSSHLIRFIQQIKKYIVNSFIIVVDSHYPTNIEKYCDIFLYKQDNFNVPHGTGELSQIKLGLSILENLDVEIFTKFNYDFWFNANIYNKYIEWQKLIDTKKIVSSAWRLNNSDVGMPNSMACAFGVYKLSAAKELFNFNSVHYPIEMQLYKRAYEIFNKDDIYLYPHFIEAFSEENFDIFNNSGDTYSSNRLESTMYE